MSEGDALSAALKKENEDSPAAVSTAQGVNKTKSFDKPVSYKIIVLGESGVGE